MLRAIADVDTDRLPDVDAKRDGLSRVGFTYAAAGPVTAGLSDEHSLARAVTDDVADAVAGRWPYSVTS